jgi:hypothetical protein
MRRGTHTRVAKCLTAKLMSRQKSLLDSWLKTLAGKNAVSRGLVSYDDLPSTLTRALERVKNQETLWMDVERYLGDVAMNMRYGADADLSYENLPYAVLTVRPKMIDFRITDKSRRVFTGSEPIARFPVTGLKRLVKVLNMHGITDKNCEVI